MPDICSTCLSEDRKLRPLDSLSEAATLLWIYHYQDVLSPSSLLCWECVADVRRIIRFKQRAKQAKAALLLNKHEGTPLLSFSTLTACTIPNEFQEEYLQTKQETACDSFQPNRQRKDDHTENDMKVDKNDDVHTKNYTHFDKEGLEPQVEHIKIDRHSELETEIIDKDIYMKTELTIPIVYESDDDLRNEENARTDFKDANIVTKTAMIDVQNVLTKVAVDPRLEKRDANADVTVKGEPKMFNYKRRNIKTESIEPSGLRNVMTVSKNNLESVATKKVVDNRVKKSKLNHPSAVSKENDNDSNFTTIVELTKSATDEISVTIVSNDTKKDTNDPKNDTIVSNDLETITKLLSDPQILNNLTTNVPKRIYLNKDGQNYRIVKKKGVQTESPKPVEPCLTCEICGQIFTRSYTLTKHMMNHLNREENLVLCPRCGVKVLSLERHMLKCNPALARDREENLLPCPICDVKVLYEKLEQHLSECSIPNSVSTTNSGRPVCPYCYKSLSCRKILERHIQVIHEKIYPYYCHICGEGVQALRDHIRFVHEGVPRHPKNVVKKNICQYCGLAFYLKITLTNHLTIHTGERPFHCAHCEKKFKTRTTLVGHLRAVHPEHINLNLITRKPRNYYRKNKPSK